MYTCLSLRSLIIHGALATVLLAGCGSSKGSDDDGGGGGKDAGMDGDNMMMMTNPDGGDDGGFNNVGDITISGVVNESGVGAVGAGVAVYTYTAAGAPFAMTTTNANGEFSVGAAANKAHFVRVESTDTHVGLVRPFQAQTQNWTIDGGMTLETRGDFSGNVTSAGSTYDDGKGHVVVGFTLEVDTMKGFDADLSATFDAKFVVDSDGAVQNDFPIPDKCPSAGTCLKHGADVPFFFANVDTGNTTISLTDATGADCAFRFAPGNQWPVFADTRTLAVVDCTD